MIPEGEGEDEREEGKLTLGQRLALKYQMKEKPKKQKTPSPPQSTGTAKFNETLNIRKKTFFCMSFKKRNHLTIV